MDTIRVTAPASSANLGPGFDTLALALDLPFEMATAPTAGDGNAAYLKMEPTHPAFVAFTAAGGDPQSELYWRSPIPPGRGLGFSGAARVAGAFLGLISIGEPEDAATPKAFDIAAGLEGHGDNAAASTYGGLCIAGAAATLRVDTPPGLLDSLGVVVWSPQSGTSTKAARMDMEDFVPLSVAVESIERTATWVAAMASGRLELLRDACVDGLHQPSRLAARPDSAAVLTALLEEPLVLAAWLSGSGPSVAAMVPIAEAAVVQDHISSRLSSESEPGSGELPAGRIRVLKAAQHGVKLILD